MKEVVGEGGGLMKGIERGGKLDGGRGGRCDVRSCVIQQSASKVEKTNMNKGIASI